MIYLGGILNNVQDFFYVALHFIVFFKYKMSEYQIFLVYNKRHTLPKASFM